MYTQDQLTTIYGGSFVLKKCKSSEVKTNQLQKKRCTCWKLPLTFRRHHDSVKKAWVEVKSFQVSFHDWNNFFSCTILCLHGWFAKPLSAGSAAAAVLTRPCGQSTESDKNVRQEFEECSHKIGKYINFIPGLGPIILVKSNVGNAHILWNEPLLLFTNN